MYGLPWILILCHKWGHSAMIFTSDENHGRIASRVTVTHILFYFLHAIICIDRAHKPAKTISNCPLRHFPPGRSCLTWHCDVTAETDFITHVSTLDRDQAMELCFMSMWQYSCYITLAKWRHISWPTWVQVPDGTNQLPALHWSHNEPDGVSKYQPRDCLLNCLFRRRSKKTSKLRVTGLCVGNSPGTGEFPALMASNTENVSIWWRHHVNQCWLNISKA